ncbi:MAG TPA: c-type cytochrome [Gaiellaceae bacterium]|nr:c-type cytochrome [Gaiellaceae bacterium]
MVSRTAPVATAMVAALAISVPAALGRPAAAPSAKSTFVSTCGSCHTLKAAGTHGVVGPDLDKVMLSQPQIVTAITKGGSAVMTKAQLAKYKSVKMPPFASLGSAKIKGLAAYIHSAMSMH